MHPTSPNHLLLLLSTLLPLTLASPQQQIPTPLAAPPAPITTIPPATSLTPEQQSAKFASDYSLLLASATTDPNFIALASAPSAGSVPRPVANAQEIAYINALKTASAGEIVPQPSFIAGLPQEQQDWMRGFHEELARVARADFGTDGGNASLGSETATASATDSAAVVQTTVPPAVVTGNGTSGVGNATSSVVLSTTAAAPSTSASAGPSGNGTAPAAPGLAPGREMGVWKVAAAAAVGVLGVMILL
ncbi:MAG: hypothetical protein Q9220_004358 [cf. Caloplaca sp. 1 TL-2023]